MANPVSSRIETATATIASGASLSGGVNLGGRVLAGIVMPSGWTAGDITFQASPDGSTWYELSSVASDGTISALTITSPAASGYYALVNNADWFAVKHLKIRSGTSAAAVNQGAERFITLLLADSWG